MIAKNVFKTCGNCANCNLSYMICAFEGNVVNWHTCSKWKEIQIELTQSI
jgi:hypothetical protein